MDHHLAFLSKMYPAGGAVGEKDHSKGSSNASKPNDSVEERRQEPMSKPKTAPALPCLPGASPILEEPYDDESTGSNNKLLISPYILPDSEVAENKTSDNTSRASSIFKRAGNTNNPPKTVSTLNTTLSRGRAKSRSFSTNLRRRHSTGTNNKSINNKLSDTNDSILIDDFIQKSSRVQAFLGHAWQHVKHATSSNNKENNKETCSGKGNSHSETRVSSTDNRRKTKRTRHGQAMEAGTENRGSKDTYVPQHVQAAKGQRHDPSSRLLREQTTEIWRLKRQLEQVQQEHLALQTTHQTLHQELHSSQNRAQRAKTALRLASENARSARADADAAETTAAQIAKQLQDMQMIVQETQKVTKLLKEDQAQVQQTVSQAETTLHHKSLELTRAQQQILQQKSQQEFLQAAKTAWERQRQEIQSQLTEKKKLAELLERQNHESHALAEARLERLQSLQQEWRHAQTLLEEVTQSKFQTEQTIFQLSEAVTQLQASNEELHQQMQALQANSHDQAIQQQDALSQAEKTGLQLKIQKESLQEELNRFQQMANHKTAANSKLNTRYSLPHSTPHNKTTGTTTAAVVMHLDTSKLPQLSLTPLNQVAPSSSDHHSASSLSKSPHDHCGICGGLAYGLMKRCQCGRATCPLRAHLTCANQLNSIVPSIAHPGTPAPRLPLILCSTVDTANNATKQPSNSSTL